MLSVMSGLLKVNILDRITFGDNSDTTEYGSSSNVVPQYKSKMSVSGKRTVATSLNDEDRRREPSFHSIPHNYASSPPCHTRIIGPLQLVVRISDGLWLGLIHQHVLYREKCTETDVGYENRPCDPGLDQTSK